MKQSVKRMAGLLGIAMLIGCSSQAMIIDSAPDTEKIQIVGQVVTPAPTEEADTVASGGDSDPVSVTPEPVLLTAAPTEEPTEAPTPEPTEVPTAEPTAVPTEEPTEVPTEEPTAAPTPEPENAPEFSVVKSGGSQCGRFCSVAESLLGASYYRGGTDPELGFDPGGFVYYCLNQSDVKVRHKTSKGYSENEGWQRVDSMDDLLPGDLCFFMTPGNDSVNCVCIYLGNGQIIYPSSGEGKVITAKITSEYWTEAFVFARRVF